MKPIVVKLPARLEQAFGSARHYTYPQAKRGIADVGIGRRAVPYALAAACTLEELREGRRGHVGRRTIDELRAELAELFSLASADFTMENLQSRQFNAHHPAPEKTSERRDPGRPEISLREIHATARRRILHPRI